MINSELEVSYLKKDNEFIYFLKDKKGEKFLVETKKMVKFIKRYISIF